MKPKDVDITHTVVEEKKQVFKRVEVDDEEYKNMDALFKKATSKTLTEPVGDFYCHACGFDLFSDRIYDNHVKQQKHIEKTTSGEDESMKFLSTCQECNQTFASVIAMQTHG